MEYLEVTLQKPMGIVLEENDPKIRGVYVKSLSQGGAAAASGKIQAGDHLISVQGASVTGKDLDTVLATVGNAPAEGVQMKFYRGALGDIINPKVFFDIDIGGERAGRVTCRLRKDVVPKTAGTFLACSSVCFLSLCSFWGSFECGAVRIDSCFISLCLLLYIPPSCFPIPLSTTSPLSFFPPYRELPRALHGREGLRLQGFSFP
jgi:hypothetical protein